MLVAFVKEENMSDKVSEVPNNTVMWRSYTQKFCYSLSDPARQTSNFVDLYEHWQIYCCTHVVRNPLLVRGLRLEHAIPLVDSCWICETFFGTCRRDTECYSAKIAKNELHICLAIELPLNSRVPIYLLWVSINLSQLSLAGSGSCEWCFKLHILSILVTTHYFLSCCFTDTQN